MWILPLLLALTSHAAIFGNDNRSPLYPTSPESKRGRSVALGVLSSLVEESSPSTYRLNTSSTADFLCPTEKFSSEPYLTYSCTGFLVGPDLLVTAGHCAVNGGEAKHEKQMYCEAYSWLFDFQETEPGKLNTETVPKQNLYRCQEIIYAVLEDKAPYRDYALIRLDRPVADRAPLELSSAPLSSAEKYSMIGHPLGTAAKLTDGARLLTNRPERQSFLTSLDAFEGNSGSPVFNSQNEVTGILIGGTPSNSLIESGQCTRTNRCDENGENCLLPDSDEMIRKLPGYQGVGSEVQRIAPIQELLKGL